MNRGALRGAPLRMVEPHPAFPRQSGCCIVVGCAPCAADDFAAARALRPEAKVMAVNGAAALAPADFQTGMHLGHLGKAAAIQFALFGRRTTLHYPYPALGRRVSHWRRQGAPVPEEAGLYDHAWIGAQCGATSAWAGVRIAKGMGFSEIVLAGVTLAVDGLAPGVYEAALDPLAWTDRDAGKAARYRAALLDYVAAGEGAGVYSMSGFTAEVLGVPPVRCGQGAQAVG